jgi:hypothetical protein
MRAPHVIESRAGRGFARPPLVDGETTSGEVTVMVFPTTTRTPGYHQFDRWGTEILPPACMADGGGT